jgi:hypothetical protein
MTKLTPAQEKLVNKLHRFYRFGLIEIHSREVRTAKALERKGILTITWIPFDKSAANKDFVPYAKLTKV